MHTTTCARGVKMAHWLICGIIFVQFVQVSQLNALITMLIGTLTVGDRQRIMTICTIEEHNRDVVNKLITVHRKLKMLRHSLGCLNYAIAGMNTRMIALPTFVMHSSAIHMNILATVPVLLLHHSLTGWVFSEWQPSNATVFSEWQPSNATVFNEWQPSNATVFSEWQPSTATVFNEWQPSNTTVFSEWQPSNTTVFSEWQPSNATVFSEWQPRNATVFSEWQPSYVVVDVI